MVDVTRQPWHHEVCINFVAMANGNATNVVLQLAALHNFFLNFFSYLMLHQASRVFKVEAFVQEKEKELSRIRHSPI